ncbi:MULTISPECIES: pentapeptide repeat-containing protein [unclassified Anabaena]|uniref:pentapeptide repeat-containing protein n=1 Tax=unclassified Anabaena TaxID=2619674 RepID=UPI0039C5C389
MNSDLPTAKAELDTSEKSKAEFLQQLQGLRLEQAYDAITQKAEAVASVIAKKADSLNHLGLFATFILTVMQIPHVYFSFNAEVQQRKFTAWEMIHYVVEKDTSAGLAIALTTLAESCEQLSGLKFKPGKYLPGIELKGNKTSLLGINLPGNKNCSQVDLRGIELKDANLQSAKFHHVNMVGANLQNSNLSGAKITIANLSKVNLQQTNLSRATLQQVDLSGANLSEADLKEANLKNTQLCTENEKGEFVCADLRGAKNLTVAQIKATKGWENAKFDASFKQELDNES